eukprot:Ihof_evm4s616 gene=Ihof_evmTU4s616
MTITSVLTKDVQVRVSSTLNRDVKQYGKKYLLDGKEDTCWNSDNGESQYIILKFPSAVKVKELQIMFQGGFVAKDCQLLGNIGENS